MADPEEARPILGRGAPRARRAPAVAGLLACCGAAACLSWLARRPPGQYPPWMTADAGRLVARAARCDLLAAPADGVFVTRRNWSANPSIVMDFANDRRLANVTRRHCEVRDAEGTLAVTRLGPITLDAGESLLFEGDLFAAPPASSHLANAVLMQPRALDGSFVAYPPMHLHHIITVPVRQRALLANATPALLAFRPLSYANPYINGWPTATGDVTSCGESTRCKVVSFPRGFGWDTHGDPVRLNGVLNNVQLRGAAPLTFTVDVLANWIPRGPGVHGLAPLSFYVSDAPLPFVLPAHLGPAVYWTTWRMPDDGDWRMPALHMHGSFQIEAWIVHGCDECLRFEEEEAVGPRLKRLQLRRAGYASVSEAQQDVRGRLAARGAALLCAFVPTRRHVSAKEAREISVEPGAYDRGSVETTYDPRCQRFSFRAGDAITHYAWMRNVASPSSVHSLLWASARFASLSLR